MNNREVNMEDHQMEIYEIVIIELNTKAEFLMRVEVDEAETSDNIIIHAIINEQPITFENYNYYSAFQLFRDKMLEFEYGIKCNGSKLNAVQSGLMSATDKVYLVELGKKAAMKDIVHIWDYAEIDSFPDTKQQNVFFEQWVKSR